jgi:integrase
VPAFVADGESWSSSALALALGAIQRTVQRALDSLASEGKVQWFGRARASLDHHARTGIRDDFVTPRSTPGRLGWHTFRHTYSTLLRSVGTEFKVMQELLRHSNLRSNFGRLHAGSHAGETRSAGGRCGAGLFV